MRRTNIHGVLTILALAAALATGCVPTAGEEGAVQRGDELFARGDLEAALAEYRLAIRQGDDSAPVYARAAHVYAVLGRVEEAREMYGAAVDRDGGYADQAVADLVYLARRAEERNDRFGVASAMESVSTFRPGVAVEELALPLARHYSRSGEQGKALPFYQKALGDLEGGDPEVMYEAALAYEEVGDCERAMIFLEQYKEAIPRWRHSEVDWHLGNCALQQSRRYQEEEDMEQALAYIQRMIEVGEPRTLLPQAYFEQGEILAALGQCEAAMDSFREAILADPSDLSPLVRRARERIDQIRFGSPTRFLRPDGAC